MRNFFKRGLGIILLAHVLVFSLTAQQPVEISVTANKPVTDVQPTMWGVFFEDINFAADGGLYAELVKNRSFEFSLPMMGWRQIGTIDIDMVSLFPSDTWKNRPGGLRKDLVQMIADLKPGFIRFPGGCIVEGRDLTNRYQWKSTICL
jgi:alpha-L-arabinofuranosidase